MIPLFLLNLVGGRKAVARIIVLVVIAAVVGAIAYAGWTVKGWKDDSAAYRDMKPKYDVLVAAQAKANEKVEKLAPVDESAARELVEAKAVIARQAGELSRAWGRVRALQETPDEATGCPVVRLSDDWGVFFSATTTGIAPDPASGEADRGDGPVPPG